MKKIYKIPLHIVFWITVGYIFTHYSFLRPGCRDAHLYKEVVCALMIAAGVYLNTFYLFPKLYVRGKYLLFWGLNTLLILSLGFSEFQLIKPDINFIKNLISVKDYSHYLISVFILVSLRDAAFLAFFYIIRVNRDVKQLLKQRQQLLAIENKQIIVMLSSKEEILISIKDIVYISSERNRVTVHLYNNKKYSQYHSLSYMEEILPDYLYVRINRSNIIMYKYVCDFDEHNVTLIINDNLDEIKIPILQSERIEKLKILKKYVFSDNKMNGEVKRKKKVKKWRSKKDEYGEVNDISKQILETIRQKPSIFASEIKKKLPHFSERNIDRYLKQLKTLGLIEYKGSPKKGGYYPV